MKKRFAIGLILGFLLAISSAWATQSSAAVSTGKDQQITIGVYDYAQAGSEVLPRAEHVTDGMLQNAGVYIAWLSCSADESSPRNAGCANLAGPLKITLHIVPGSKKERLSKNRDAFGLAVEEGAGEFACDTWVFYDQIRLAAASTGLDLPQILGSVIAHELGHLLLGANSHSRTGLMCARWSRKELLAADLGELSFSDSERARIRNSVVARQIALQAAQ
jgi:hypothetical protein